MNNLNNERLDDRYCAYKATVKNFLKKRGINTVVFESCFDNSCRGFFLDEMPAYDCARHIAENHIEQERAALSEAKRIMREHGYRVKKTRE